MTQLAGLDDLIVDSAVSLEYRGPRGPPRVEAAIVFGVLFGGFLMVSFALRRDDRDLGAIHFDAPNHGARAVRSLVGMTTSRME